MHSNLSLIKNHDLLELDRTLNDKETILAVHKYDNFKIGALAQLLRVVYTLNDCSTEEPANAVVVLNVIQVDSSFSREQEIQYFS